jgi:protein TonB
MRPHRLSFEAAGAAAAPGVDALSAPRPPLLAVVPAAVPVAPAYGRSSYGRSPGQRRQRRLVVAAMVALHALLVLGLLGASRLRETAVEARPVFLAVVDAPAPPAPSRPLPPPPSATIPPPPTLSLPLIAPEPSPSPSPLVAQVVAPPPPAPAPPAAPVPAPTPAPAPSLPRTIPPSAVEYLVPPTPVYSRISAKMHESGTALVRVYIDEAGLPREVQLVKSTGFARLDDSAVTAVRKVRFKPYVENGVAIAGWASIPIEFELPT